MNRLWPALLTNERVSLILLVHFIAAREKRVGVNAVKPQHVAQVLAQTDLQTTATTQLRQQNIQTEYAPIHDVYITLSRR